MSAPSALPIARPLFGPEEAAAAARVLASGWVMQGPEVAAFERELAALVGAAHACAVSSGTAALHLALRALELGPGDQVITVSHSFIATANAVRLCGAEPVFVDVAPGTFNLDPARLEAAITPRTRAILAVHQLGLPCELAALDQLARRHGLALVEDAACAAGSELQWGGAWERVGRPRGVMACFSFHPRKVISTGEGGMITTADAALDARLRSLRQHGVDPAGAVVELGFNYRMTDLQAAVGRVQLERLPGLVAERRRLAARYAAALSDLPGLVVPSEPAWARSNWQSYCVLLPDGADGADRSDHEGRVDRDAIARRLAERGIATRPGIANAHQQPAYAGAVPPVTLPVSEAASRRGLMLPLFPGMSDMDVERVATELAAALRS